MLFSSYILIQPKTNALFSDVVDDAFILYEKLGIDIGFYYNKHLYVVESPYDRYSLLDQYNDRNMTGTQLAERVAQQQRSQYS